MFGIKRKEQEKITGEIELIAHPEIELRDYLAGMAMATVFAKYHVNTTNKHKAKEAYKLPMLC